MSHIQGMERRLTPLAAGLLVVLWVVEATCARSEAAEFGSVGRTEYNSLYMNGCQMSQIQEAIKAIKAGDKKTGQGPLPKNLDRVVL